MGVMATVSPATAAPNTANDFGPNFTWIMASWIGSLMSDKSFRVDTNNRFKALLNVPLRKAFSWSTSQFSKASTTPYSEMLITRSFILLTASCIIFSTILWTSPRETRCFSTKRGLSVDLDTDLKCSLLHTAPACFMTSISWPSYFWVFSLRLCGRLLSSFKFALVHLDYRARRLMKVSEFLTCSANCRSQLRNWSVIGLHLFSTWTSQNSHWDW